MIPLTAAVCQATNRKTESWQQELANAIRDPEELLAMVGLTPEQIPGGVINCGDFPLRVPRGYATRMEQGNAQDPLLLQVLSQRLEIAIHPDYHLDPVGDGQSVALPGLLHKYHGRVLLITTGACPIHCRYCFRRHFPYSESRPESKDWTEVMEHIAADPSIKEVIFSGGDPLSLSTERLNTISQQLAEIPHISRLRIHTRMPIVLPERINTDLLEWLGNLPWKILMVVHCNHAQEVDTRVASALASLSSIGVTLLNQAVLLRGVNDNVPDLVNLQETLFTCGVLPYYLHMLDHVIGAGHFEVDENRAQNLVQKLQVQLPGFLVPKLVKEVAGQPHKIQVS